MAEPNLPHEEHDDEEETPGYKPPAKKDLDSIVNQDADDESLERYKKALLGETGCAFPENEKNVIVSKLALIVTGREDIELNLMADDLSKLKKSPLVLKEGIEYRVKIYFYVQRDIVAGLRYKQVTSRKGIKVEKQSFMVGSYGPKKEEQSYTTPMEEAPKGMLARGTYTVKSQFTDDDKFDHLSWDWQVEIKKDWD